MPRLPDGREDFKEALMAIADLKVNATYVIPVSVRGKVIDLVFDTTTQEYEDFFKKEMEIVKAPIRDEKLPLICKEMTLLLCEYSPEVKESLNGELLMNPHVWIKFFKAQEWCLQRGLTLFFTDILNKYSGVVKLL